MKYSGNANPFLSRKTYSYVCEWWSRSTANGQISLAKMAYEMVPTGKFHARPSTEYTFNKKNESDIRISNNYVAIETPDDVSAIRADDLVRYGGILYRVDNVVKREIVRTREFMRRPLCVFVLQLER